MPSYRAPRGTRDLLPDVRGRLGRLEEIARSLSARYGYREVEIPLFEQSAVFERGIGEATDVVEKELFRLAPRTEESESWALRPEATAGPGSPITSTSHCQNWRYRPAWGRS